MGLGLVSQTLATAVMNVCRVEDAAPGDQVAVPDVVVVGSENGENVRLDARCLEDKQSEVVVSPFAYLSTPPWLFFFEPFTQTTVPRIESAEAAALANEESKAFKSFQELVTLPESVRFHALYQKYRPQDSSNLYKRLLVAGNQLLWAQAAVNRVGYGAWFDEAMSDYESASWQLQQQPSLISTEVATLAVRDAKRDERDVCGSDRSVEERSACLERVARTQNAALELAVVAAGNGLVNRREGASLAVALDDRRRNNREFGERRGISDREVRDIALALDAESVFRRGNTSDEEYKERINAFSEHMKGVERIDLDRNRDVYVIQQNGREVELRARDFDAKLKRDRAY